MCHLTQAMHRWWFSKQCIVGGSLSSDCDNRRARLFDDKTNRLGYPTVVWRRKDASPLQIATSDAYTASHILQHIVIFESATPMLHISLVHYGVRNKQADPRSKFIAMARFLRFVLRQKRQVKHIVTLKSLRTLKNFATSGWEMLL